MGATRRAVRRWLAVCLAAGLGFGGAGVARAQAQPDLRGFYGQKVAWGGCTGQGPPTARCGDVTVPLDYAHPEGRTLDVAVSRIPATGPGPKLGSLVVNFGGPGLSGITGLADRAPELAALNRRYDLVGFDPRGVARSAPVDCGDLTRITGPAQLARACAHISGWLLPYLSTPNTARDLDVIRQTLGDDRLTYLGFSYGSTLGAVYAHEFPTRVGRIALDGVPDPTLGAAATALAQAGAFQTALTHFAADCAARGCPVPGRTGARVLAGITSRAKDFAHRPMATDEGVLDQDGYLQGLRNALYSKDDWPYLREALRDLRDGNGDLMMRLAYPGSGGQASRAGRASQVSGGSRPGPADEASRAAHAGQADQVSHADHVDRASHPGQAPADWGAQPQDNYDLAKLAIDCRDSPERPTPAQLHPLDARFTAASSLFGRAIESTLLSCTGWPRGTEGTRDVAAPTAPETLLVSTTGDPATPYEGAHRMAQALRDDSRVLTYRGDGHGAYFAHNACVSGAVNAYFLDGTLPGPGAVC